MVAASPFAPLKEGTVSRDTHQEIFDHRYMTAREVCYRLSIDPSTLTAWLNKGKFPREHVLCGERFKLWVREEIEPVINRINLESPVRV